MFHSSHFSLPFSRPFIHHQSNCLPFDWEPLKSNIKYCRAAWPNLCNWECRAPESPIAHLKRIHCICFFFNPSEGIDGFTVDWGEGAVCIQLGRRWIVGHIVMNWWLALHCSFVAPPHTHTHTYSWLLIFMMPGPFNGACRVRRLMVRRLPLCLTRAGVKLSKRNIVIWRMRTRPGTVHNLFPSAWVYASARFVSLVQNKTLRNQSSKMLCYPKERGVKPNCVYSQFIVASLNSQGLGLRDHHMALWHLQSLLSSMTH